MNEDGEIGVATNVALHALIETFFFPGSARCLLSVRIHLHYSGARIAEYGVD